MAPSDKTVEVSQETLSHLERLRDEMNAGSIDETARALIKSHRRRILAGVFGTDKGKVKTFGEGNRGDDR